MITLQFGRDLQHARPFEIEALKCVVGLGGYYPLERLDEARLEAERIHPVLPVTEGNVAVFFRLINHEGAEVIEIVQQPYPGVFSSAGQVWPGGDGHASLAIKDTVVNDHFVLGSGALAFTFELGRYVSLDPSQKRTKFKAA
jgi:hypothetical protein